MMLDDAQFNVEALRVHTDCGTCDVLTPYGLIQITRHHKAFSIYAPSFSFGGGLYDEDSAVQVVNSLIQAAKNRASSHNRKE